MDGMTRAVVILALAYLALMGWIVWAAATHQPPC